MHKLLKSEHLLLLLVLILAASLLSVNITKPFIGHHDWNGQWYGNVARNHLRYGLLVTKLGSVSSGGPVDFNQERIFFTHYPPLFPLILAAGYKIFGQTELALRITMSFFSLLSVSFIFLLAKRLFSLTVAFLAGLFSVVTPMYLYFGKLPVHEVVVLSMALGSFYFYVKCFFDAKRIYFYLCSFFIIVGLFVSWPAYFVPPLLFLHYIFRHPTRSHWRLFGSICIAMIAIFGLHLIHIRYLTGLWFGGGLVEIFTTRISSPLTERLYQLTFIKYLMTEARYLLIYFTRTLAGLVILYVILRGIEYIKTRKIVFTDSVLIILLIFGAAYVSIFREAAFIHDYLLYYLLPFITISAAAFIDRVLQFFKKSLFVKSIVFLIILQVVFERLPYSKALLNSNQAEKGYKIGIFIRQQTNFTEKTFIGSSFYGTFFSTAIAHYADRTVDYGEKITMIDLDGFDWVVRPKAHDALGDEVKSQLDQRYKRWENTDFIWYNLHQLAYE